MPASAVLTQLQIPYPWRKQKLLLFFSWLSSVPVKKSFNFYPTMASPSLATSTLTSSSSSLLSPKAFLIPSTSFSSSFSPSIISISRRGLKSISDRKFEQKRNTHHRGLTIKAALTLDFSGSFFEGGIDDEESPLGSDFSGPEEKVEPQCPPGLRQYETMVVLRPDMSEDERLNLTQKYEELIVAGGGMYVEIFNRGVIPLAYDIKKKNRAGETNTYMDGIYLLFTYFTKGESVVVLDKRLITDDDVIRCSTFKIRKRKY